MKRMIDIRSVRDRDADPELYLRHVLEGITTPPQTSQIPSPPLSR